MGGCSCLCCVSCNAGRWVIMARRFVRCVSFSSMNSNVQPGRHDMEKKKAHLLGRRADLPCLASASKAINAEEDLVCACALI